MLKTQKILRFAPNCIPTISLIYMTFMENKEVNLYVNFRLMSKIFHDPETCSCLH